MALLLDLALVFLFALQCTTSSVVYLRRMNRRALVARSQSGLHLETLDVGCSSRISVAAAVYVSAELVNALSGSERYRKGVCAAREPARMWLVAMVAPRELRTLVYGAEVPTALAVRCWGPRAGGIAVVSVSDGGERRRDGWARV
ncbi:hypothetical protein EDB83DRAFT_2550592 [Lactarius deliciosus]|nr:hypothetical protein EDB83DRAFT_2550592 [Lactarius deliciosus]